MKPDKAPFLPIMCKRFSNQFTMWEMEMDAVFFARK